MSGIQLTTENTNNAFSVASIIKQIKESQENVLKAFEEHNNLVNKSLEIIQQLKTETKVEVVKVKDPLEEIKKTKVEIDDIYEKFNHFINHRHQGEFLTKIIDILFLYGDSKISASFKDTFLYIFNKCMQVKYEGYVMFQSGVLFQKLLKVRDIRWLLLEIEKYPQYFQFYERDLELMKEHGASRDNIYLVKKFLKKDGDYEEMYEEEEGGGVKCRYHMTGGCLNGEYKEWYEDGKLEREYKDGKLEGEWVRYINGKLNILSNYKEGKLHGKYTEYKEDGTYLKECFYTEGKLINLRTYNTSGHLELKKSLINYDTYELSRYYECDGKLHEKVIMEGDKWNGEYKSWWHNGNKCIETTYKDDKIHGDYTYWNEDGTLKEKSVYKDGVKV